MTQLLLAYYGDDFTGSTDVMEVLQWAGVKTVLFLEPPTKPQLAEIDGLRAYGIAGGSRAMSLEELDAELVPAFGNLRDSGARFAHYKTCSTCDSSPTIGSIGRALELGKQVLGGGCTPVLIAAPHLGRYQAFGNLFARSGLDTEPYRLDRHPTMRNHPITPMQEADLRLHLNAQTSLAIELYDCLQLDEVRLAPPAPQADALLFDALYDRHLPVIGQIIESISRARAGTPQFLLGSSGIESALSAFWKQSGLIAAERFVSNAPPSAPRSDPLLVVTGSCSPVNDRQITWAEEHGFETIEIRTELLILPSTCQQEIERVIERALQILGNDSDLILHTARGSRDPRIAKTIAAYRQLGYDEVAIGKNQGRTLGPQLGKILLGILERRPLPRVAIAGGDTSGFVARELGLTALEAVAPVEPGAPLCRVRAHNALDGMEIMLKGGQVGRDSMWGKTRDA